MTAKRRRKRKRDYSKHKLTIQQIANDHKCLIRQKSHFVNVYITTQGSDTVITMDRFKTPQAIGKNIKFPYTYCRHRVISKSRLTAEDVKDQELALHKKSMLDSSGNSNALGICKHHVPFKGQRIATFNKVLHSKALINRRINVNPDPVFGIYLDCSVCTQVSSILDLNLVNLTTMTADAIYDRRLEVSKENFKVLLSNIPRTQENLPTYLYNLKSMYSDAIVSLLLSLRLPIYDIMDMLTSFFVGPSLSPCFMICNRCLHYRMSNTESVAHLLKRRSEAYLQLADIYNYVCDAATNRCDTATGYATCVRHIMNLVYCLDSHIYPGGLSKRKFHLDDKLRDTTDDLTIALWGYMSTALGDFHPFNPLKDDFHPLQPEDDIFY